MTVITTRITVTPDGVVSLATPLPPGEYEASLTVTAQPSGGKPFVMDGFPTHHLGWADTKPTASVLDLPVHDGLWDDSISLRREDMYGDDGR